MSKIRISENADIRALAAAMVNAAVRDFLFGSPTAQVSALEFLCSRDLSVWADAAGVYAIAEKILRDPQKARAAFGGRYHVRNKTTRKRNKTNE